jgi:hypothetical protein
MPQTGVSYRQKRWLAEGQIASTSVRRIEGAMESILNGESGNLPYGRVIHRNAENKAVLPTAAASAASPILGISVLRELDGVSIADLQLTTPAAIGFPPGSIVEYIQMGDVVVFCEEAITVADVGAPVFYRYATGAGGTVLGRVRKSAVADQAEALPNAKFLTTCPANSLVVVRIGAFAGGTAAY